MTTLAANSPRVLVGGDVNEHPVIASDITVKNLTIESGKLTLNGDLTVRVVAE